MTPSFLHIVILALVQGAAELLPVSSSAHVIFAEKLIGLDPTSPEMTFLLVMLHTGTMFSVLVYFWKKWSLTKDFLRQIVIATFFTGVIGFGLKTFIERVCMSGHAKPEIEHLFGSLPLIALALSVSGLWIFFTGSRSEKNAGAAKALDAKSSGWIGAIQGLCLPFRGFSRSGATISMGMLLGVDKLKAEEFSFALAVVLTPAVIVKEALRLMHNTSAHISNFTPGLFGMVVSFFSGMVALWLLSSLLEKGRWKFFGIYNLIFAAIIFLFSRMQ